MAEPIDPKEIYRDRSESNNVGQPAPTEEQNPDSIFRGQPNSSTSGTEVPHEAIAKDGEDTITATKLSFKRGRNDEELDASTAALDQSNDLSGGPPVHNDGIDDAKDTSPAVGIPSKEEGTGQESNALTIQKTTSTSAEPLFSVFSLTQRRLLVWVTALAGFISPMSTTIYYPALNELARDLHTTPALINLSITMYMIFQGLAPTIVGSASDSLGRRPVFMICLFIYLVTNIGLALQTNYAALMVLRCAQACGSSGTIALVNAVVADLATPAERGSFMAIAGLGTQVGTALGPIIGGLLNFYLGWKAIFWFLSICGGFFLLMFLLIIPETCRAVVGNGSVPPQPWNLSLLAYLRLRQRRRHGLQTDTSTLAKRKTRVNLLSSLPIVVEKEAGTVLLFLGVLYTGLMSIMASLPVELSRTYNFNSVQIGLCYLPLGIGGVVNRQITGRVIDWNFTRIAKQLGIEIDKGKRTKLENFPIEKARLQVAIPLVFICAAVFMAYGWVMQKVGDTGHRQPITTLAGPIVLLFFNAFCISGFFVCVSALLVDSHPQSPAAATAAANFVRCLLGAGGVAATVPLIDAIGRGWTSTIFGLLWLALSPMLWAVMKHGPRWRREQKEREEAKKKRKEAQKRDIEQQAPAAREAKGETD